MAIVLFWQPYQDRVSHIFLFSNYLVLFLLAMISIILASRILSTIFLKYPAKGIIITASFKWLLSLKAQIIVWLPDISLLTRNKYENGEKKQKDLAEMPKSKNAAPGDRLTFVAWEEKLVDRILESQMNGSRIESYENARICLEKTCKFCRFF